MEWANTLPLPDLNKLVFNHYSIYCDSPEDAQKLTNQFLQAHLQDQLNAVMSGKHNAVEEIPNQQ